MAERPRQEVRLAVVLTGGVSLAVWMGGVAREINLLTQVSRAQREGVQGTGTTDAENRLRDAYGRLLALLGVDVSIDVLSGTSAGGINGAMLGYVVAVFLSVWLLHRVEVPVLRALIALLPVPAIALAMRAIIRRVRDADELQRRIELEAISIASACVSLGYLSAGFLQLAKVIDVAASDAMIWVFPLTALIFGLAKAVLGRRYR